MLFVASFGGMALVAIPSFILGHRCGWNACRTQMIRNLRSVDRVNKSDNSNNFLHHA